MGDRAQVHIEHAGVYYYIHLEGYKVFEQVAAGLKNAGGPENLPPSDKIAGIVFDSINTNLGRTRGLGISSEPYEGVYRYVSVNAIDRTVTVRTIYEDSDDDGEYSITEFIEQFF